LPGRPAEAVFVETLFLQILAEMPPPAQFEHWPKDAVHRALQVCRDAERAAACIYLPDPPEVPVWLPEALPWVQNALRQADQHRREGERLLQRNNPLSRKQAGESLSTAGSEYATILDLMQAMAEAEKAQFEALAGLPTLAMYQSQRPHLEADEAEWNKAVQAGGDLAALLARRPGEAGGPAPRHAGPRPTLP